MNISFGKRSLTIRKANRTFNDIRLFRSSVDYHFVWWKLSIIYQWDYHCENCKDACEINGEACQECCSHEFDSGEGGMCINCNRDDYYNFYDEDYGKER